MYTHIHMYIYIFIASIHISLSLYIYICTEAFGMCTEILLGRLCRGLHFGRSPP